MVQRMERELDEEFSHLLPAEPTASPTGEPPRSGYPTGTPGTMLPAAAPPKIPPEQSAIHTETWISDEMVAEQQKWGQKPENKNNTHGATGSATRGLLRGETNQRPPDIEPAIRPPPDRDRCRRRCGCNLKGCGMHQLKGCRQERTYQKVSAKGVLDTKYLCPRPRVRERIPIHVWCPSMGTQRARLHDRSVFGRPTQ